ncbi:MAG TPA: histidine--tRNA ligase [Candidatus Saccharimonadales bacterium]|jgi:histidyl-tRNA synthetase|nr:histidine--tRNA ligase [Candidatus Saccharimonadales bacterium]
MASLSSQPYKGTRDYYPEDKRLQNYIFNTWKGVVEAFGYEEYGAPIIEPYEIFAAKTGQEIVNEQTYNFVDRGGRNVVIRPEMTPSISRMVAGRRQELGYPARLFSIANFMRYERPQKGREREFWQLNADIFGATGVDADAEIITIADGIMQAFGAKDSMYKIRINSRKLINSMMAEYLELDIMQAQLMIKLFDRKDKISHEEFRDQAHDIFDAGKAREGLQKIAKLLSAKTMGELPKELLETEAVQEVQALFTLLRERSVGSAVFDISLMRGFDYYTGIVFEVFDTHPDNNRSMFGGGRYDGLVGLFGVEPVATVGMAPGATTTEEFLKAHKLLPKLRPATDVYVIVLGDSLYGAQKLAGNLREEGVKVAVDITGRKLDKQIKAAVKLGVPFILFVGEQELQDEMYTLKDVAKSSEQKLGFERVVTTIKDYRRSFRKR